MATEKDFVLHKNLSKLERFFKFDTMDINLKSKKKNIISENFLEKVSKL